MAPVCTDYGTDSAHVRTDNQLERRSNSEVQTAEHPKIPSVEHRDSESESDTEMEIDPEEDDETIHQLLTDFTEMVIEGYTKDDWFTIPQNTDKFLLDEKGLYWRDHQLAIPATPLMLA